MHATHEFAYRLSQGAPNLRDFAARFADQRIAQLAAQNDADEWFPRDVLGQAIGALQVIQAKAADMYVALRSACNCMYAVARGCDAGTGEAVQVGAGCAKEWPVERFLRDLKLLHTGAATDESDAGSSGANRLELRDEQSLPKCPDCARRAAERRIADR